MKFIREVQSQTIPFSASNSGQLSIGAKSYWITGMLLDLEMAKTDGTTPTTNQDYLWRILTNLQITGGGRPYVKVASPDLRSLYWDTRLRLQGRHRCPDLQAGAVTTRHMLPILFGVNPIMVNDHLNLSDASAGIAPDNDLTIQVNWAAAGAVDAAGVLGTNRLIGAGTKLRVTLLGIVPETPAEEPKFFPQWSSQQWAPSQTFTGLSGLVQLTPGFFYRRTAVLAVNGAQASWADNRTDDVAESAAISEIGVRTADGRFPVGMKFWDFSQLSQGQFAVADDNGGVPGATLAGGAAVIGAGHNPGVGMIDWAQIADTSDPSKADPMYGLNMIGKQPSAASLAFTVNAATNTAVMLLHEAYNRY